MSSEFCFQVNGLKIRAEFPERDIETIYLPLLKRLSALQRRLNRRLSVFLAAPPAAGKSTLCAYLEWLSRQDPALTPVQAVGIDGFHFSNAYLACHTLQRHGQSLPLSHIKGAPETYDVEKLKRLLQNIDKDAQFWPIYDRRLHEPVEGAIELREKIILLEGNWLLLDEAPWNALKCDYSIFLRAGDPSQLERIVERKKMGGFGEETARNAVLNNDWPNIVYCMEHSRPGNLTLRRNPAGEWEEI